MFDYGHFKFENKQALFDSSIQYWNPDKTKFWQNAGIDLVIDRREGYCLYDMDGRRLIDLHLTGGTFNLGHRHPELVETLKGALDYFDIGNHWFPSVARAALSEALIKATPGMKYVVYGAGGAEAVDIAIKSARYATKRRKVVSIIKGYHGHGGLSVATGDDRFSKIFLADQPDTFIQVPFNDIAAMEQALKAGAVREIRRALHCRRSADRNDALWRIVGMADLQYSTRHHGNGQRPFGRPLPHLGLPCE
jgi:acetylornithine/succinyldiaminopimelate/putrescine aminotransferase